MTTIRKIVTSKIDGNSADTNDANEIRPFGEIAVYLNTEANPDKLTLMMFDGIRTHIKSMVLAPGRLYGSDADSGDGNGYDTIKLIPDASLSDFTNNDQYLIIDPTSGDPGHIHIRAGGVQDSSGADLYLGAEQTFVRVSDTDDNVTIRTSTVGEGITPYAWVFDSTGSLILPSGQPILFGNGNSRIQAGMGFHINSEEGISLEAVDISNPLSPITKGWHFGTNGNLTFSDNTVQTTAWAGGRVVSVPGSSIGATGDMQNDIAFNGSYIYYCTQDFVEASYPSTIVTTYSGTFPTIVKGSIPRPQAGWVLVHNSNSYTLDSNATDGNTGEWVLSLSSSISVTAGDAVTIGPASVADIWKRVAWSNDTW